MNVNTIIFNQVMKLAISITGRLYTLLEILPDLELNLLSKYDCDFFILVNTVDRKLYKKEKKKRSPKISDYLHGEERKYVNFHMM